MGALSNSGRKAANLTGFYKGIQSAGAAVFWRLDGLKTPFNTMFGATVRPSPFWLPSIPLTPSPRPHLHTRSSPPAIPPAYPLPTTPAHPPDGTRNRTRANQ